MILDYIIVDAIRPSSGIIPKKYKLRGYYPAKSGLINILMREFKLSFYDAKTKAFSNEMSNILICKPI